MTNPLLPILPTARQQPPRQRSSPRQERLLLLVYAACAVLYGVFHFYKGIHFHRPRGFGGSDGALGIRGIQQRPRFFVLLQSQAGVEKPFSGFCVPGRDWGEGGAGPAEAHMFFI